MGSAKMHSNPQTPMADNTDKKSIKSILKSFFHKDKKKGKKDETQRVKDTNTPKPTNDFADEFKKLEISERSNSDDDEFLNFERKVIEDEGRVERIDSHSSEDSGFADAREGEVVDAFESLEIKEESKEKCEKKKKLQTVVAGRGPIRTRINDFSAHPYQIGQEKHENSYKQISLNTQSLSGGHVIVTTTQNGDNYTEVDAACDRVKEISAQSLNAQDYWSDVLELIDEETKTHNAEDPLSDFQVDKSPEPYSIPVLPQEVAIPNPIEMFSDQIVYNDALEMSNIFDDALVQGFKSPVDAIFLTPPHSENICSPMTGSPGSFYLPNSDYTLSPERSSPNYHSDYEIYQDIVHLDETAVEERVEKKQKESTSSPSAMTMKQFKDLQKELGVSFAKKECCQVGKACKEVFKEHLQKLKAVERRNLCLGVSKLDLKTAYGVLHHVLLSLSKSEEQESVQYALFGLICERVLTQKPSPFLGEFGLGLLKAAGLRCPQHPVLTRYLVLCVRAALKAEPNLGAGKECVFHEVDSLGEHLVTACARAGDRCAAVLAALVAPEEDQPPLFRIHHANADGYTALHVACSEHSPSNPRLHTVHVLLEHGNADLWKGDIKGGDTALHLAVNSAHCDLQLVMVMFRHVDRKLWKKLAHHQNMSSVTPLEYARSATKSTTRHNYPHEVLDFLKKCR